MGDVGRHTVYLCLQPALNLKCLLLCGWCPGLCLTTLRCLALDLMPPLPSVPGVLSRWAAEPIKHLFIPASSFIANAKGYPVLPKGSQTFIHDIMKVRTNQSHHRSFSLAQSLPLPRSAPPSGHTV